MTGRYTPARANASASARSRIRRLWLGAGLLAFAISAVAVLTGQLHLTSAPSATGVTPPWEFFDPAWAGPLGGDTTLTPASYVALAAVHTGLSAAQGSAAAASATQLAIQDLGVHPSDGTYWPPPGPAPAPPRCTDAAVLAASPTLLPTTDVRGRYYKVLVAASGVCAAETYTSASPLVTYVYLHQVGGALVGLRDWQVPAAPEPPPAALVPADWEMKTFGACSAPTSVRRDRIIVVDAFDQMCAAAAKAGVVLRVSDAFRTRAEQADLFARAVALYGSSAAARKWVAYADAGVCTSRHCSGLALDVTADAKSQAWLNATVGCNTGGVITAATGCGPGATPIARMATFGFAAPAPAVPVYLEFILPVPATSGAGSLSEPSCNPDALAVPNMVAAIFRCRLARSGVAGASADAVVAQALVVSRCESAWNADARAFNGTYALSKNPADGRTYTQAGVFMIASDLADRGWVAGGRSGLTNPVANINAAASLYLATGGWEQFGCATGAHTGFDSGPVLPAYGGPALPAWADKY